MSRSPVRRPALPPELSPRLPPGAARRRTHSPLHQLSVGVAALLSLVVLAVTSIGWAAFRYFQDSVTGVAWAPGGDRPAERPGEMNILLLGDDSRAGTGGQYGQVDGIRSDTTIIAHFGADGSATLLSFPRDTLVTVPAGIPKAPSDGRDKLTNILSYGGVEGLARTLENLTTIKIDHFMSIDLAGFKTMTDAVGGVDVCVAPLPGGGTSNLRDNWSQWHGKLGVNHLNGEQALAFVRTRHALPDETYRVARQQHFLSKLLEKTTSTGVLTNPVRITQLIGAVGGSLKVDKGLTEDDAMVGLAQRVGTLARDKVRFLTIPTYVPMQADGAVDDKGTVPPHGQVLFYDPVKLAALLAPLRPATGDDTDTGAATLQPGQVTVAEVRNRTGRSGLAAQTSAALATLGFAGPLTTTTGPAGQVITEIRYSAGRRDAARTLAAAIPGSTSIEDPTISRGLVLVLGASFTGVRGTATTTDRSPATGSPATGQTPAEPAQSPAATGPAASCVP